MGKRKIAVILFIIVCCALIGIVGKSRRNNTNAIEATAGITYTTLDIQKQIGKIKQVAITFDDGPHLIYTAKLLDGLKERNVKATFFLMGKNIEGNEEIVKRISEEGHLIGNHTYNHVQLTSMSVESANEEIFKDSKVIYKITGEYPKYIRPPFGLWSDSLNAKTGLKAVLWDIDPRDWECQNAQIVYNRVIKNVEGGDIILLHDIFDSSVEAAFEIIDELTAEGYEFVTVDRLAEE